MMLRQSDFRKMEEQRRKGRASQIKAGEFDNEITGSSLFCISTLAGYLCIDKYNQVSQPDHLPADAWEVATMPELDAASSRAYMLKALGGKVKC